jgi:hypothetical protein
MLLNPDLAFRVCCSAQDLVWWECCVWWWWVVLVSVKKRKILTFAICHLVISGVSWYSWLWLELVLLVILLASISRPGTLDLSLVSVVRALSAGDLSSCREGAQISGVCRRWRPETGSVPETVSFCSPHSHLHRLVSEGSKNQGGSLRCSGKALPGGVDTSPLAGRCLDVWSPKWGQPQMLCCFCLSQKPLASLVHTLPCAD